MAPYLLVISSSILLFYLGENWAKANEDKRIKYIILLIAILLPCALAGARDEGVGLDTRGYGRLIFDAAKSSDGLMECWGEVSAGGYDIAPLFFLQAYIVVKLTGSQFFYYLAIQALTIIPFYLAIKRVAGPSRLWLGMTAYYLIIYMLSLSAMRQCVAMGIVTLSVVLLVDKSYIKSIALFIISVLMHSSAFVCIFVYIGWISFVKFNEDPPALRKHSNVALPLLALLLLAVWMNIENVLNFVVSLPMFEDYSKYLFGATTTNYKSFFVFFGGMLLSLCPIAFYAKDGVRIRLSFWLILALVAIPVYWLQTYNEQFIRLSYLFWPFYVIAFAECSSISAEIPKKALLVCLAVFLTLAFMQFVWGYWINNFFEFLPYKSALLGL